MQIRLGELRAVILEMLEETYRRTGVRDTRPAWEREPGAYDKPEKGKGSLAIGAAAAAQDTEDEIEEMRGMPEYVDLDAFMTAKLASEDDDAYSYTWMDLQALARNLAAARTGHPDAVAGKNDVDTIKREMEKVGFTFIPREVARAVRGATSNSHGTHPFAGSGGGGSGFSSDKSGDGGFTSFGGGPGAIGGGVPWNKGDSRNLPMGSARRR